MKIRFLIFLAFVFASLLSSAQDKVALEQVISATLEKNYDILLSKNNATNVSLDNQYAFGAFLPQVNANGSMVWNSSDQSLEFANPANNREGKAESNNLVGSVSLNWTLFDGTKMFATRTRVASIARQGELQLKDQMTNTISAVINTYFNIVRQKQQLNAIVEQMAVSEERVKLAERKLSVGIGSKPELLQAKVDLNAQRTQVLQQEANIALLKEQMNSQTGMMLPPTYDVADSIPVNLDLKLEELSSNIENSNFTLQATKWNLIIADKLLSERRADLLPVVSLTGAYTYSETDNTKLLNPFGSIYFQNQGYNYGLAVSLPLLNGFNNRRLIEQSKVNINRQKLVYDQQKLNVDINLKNAFTNYENAKKILVVEEENILLAKENVNIALESFKRGISNFIELRTAQQSLSDAYNRLIAARFNAKTSETELLRLKGGLLK